MVRGACSFLGLLLAWALPPAGVLPAEGQTKGKLHEPTTRVETNREPASTLPQGPVEVPRPSEKALRYYRSGMWLWGFNQFWDLLVPGLIAFSGLSALLRSVAHRLGKSWFLTVGLYVLFYLAIDFLIDLPISYYEEFVRQHAYGLSNQTVGKWLSDSLVRLAIQMTVGFAFTWVPYLLLDRVPRRWWQITTVLAVPFLLFTALVKPIWIDPLYNKYGPMKTPTLERSILALAQRAGIDGSRVFEVQKSVDTKTVNAYVTGLWGTKRIVLWDTLLARLDEQEVLVVMAHEMGHYVLGHVVRSILLSSIILLAGLFLVDRLGRRIVSGFSRLLGFDNLADIASVPLLLMLIQFSTLLLEPVVMAYSRYQEREADQFALDLTGANHAGAMAFVKLQKENLSNPYPGFVYRIFRASHPSISERIDFFNTYRPKGPTILQKQQEPTVNPPCKDSDDRGEDGQPRVPRLRLRKRAKPGDRVDRWPGTLTRRVSVAPGAVATHGRAGEWSLRLNDRPGSVLLRLVGGWKCLAVAQLGCERNTLRRNLGREPRKELRCREFKRQL